MTVNRKPKRIGVLLLFLLLTFLVGCQNEKSAKSYYKDGIKLFKEGRYEEAKSALFEANKRNSNKAEYKIDYGYALIKTGEYKEALTQFNHAIQKTNNKIVNENNKRAYRGKGITYYNNRDYENALKEFDYALQIKQNKDLTVDILYYKGDCEEKIGDYKNAIKTYTSIIDREEKDVQGYTKRAKVYLELKDRKKSIVDYEKAISIEPKNLDLYLELASVYKKQDNLDLEEKILSKAFQQIKDKDYYNQGRIYYYQGDYKQAITNFNKAVKNKEDKAYFFLGEIYAEQKEYEKAINNFENYRNSSSDSKDGLVYNELGSCYLALNKNQEALDVIQLGIKENDNTVMKSLKYNEIIAYEKLIQFDEAYKKMKEYLTLYKEDEAAKKEFEFIKTRITAS